MPKVPKNKESRSIQLCCLMAAIMPKGIPTKTAMNKAVMVRISVPGNASFSKLVTGLLL